MPLDIQYELIGNRIKLRRKELKIKQSELAELINISNNHMSSIENGSMKTLLYDCSLYFTNHIPIKPVAFFPLFR